MDRKTLRRLIEEGELSKALDQLASFYEGSRKEKEVSLLKARYRGLQKERDNGLLGWEQFNLEQNRIRQAVLNLEQGEVEVLESNRSWQKVLLITIAVLIGTGSLLYLQYGQSDARPAVQEAPADELPVIDIAAAVEKTLAEREFNAWIEENAKDGEFWASINGTTQEMADQRLRGDAATRQKLKAQAEELVAEAIRKALQQLEVDGVEVEVASSQVALFDGGKVAL